MYEQEKSEIQILKSYLQTQIPATPLPPNDVLLSPNSVALKAAIAGLDKELGRLEREERLVKKFTANNEVGSATSTAAAAASKKRAEDDADIMEYVQMTKEDAAGGNNDDVAMMDDSVKGDDDEWEEANPSPAKKYQRQEEKQQMEDESEAICQKLASSAVARIANANIKVATPLSALGLALHTALVELTDENSKDAIFKCTGVPDVGVTSQFLGVTIKGAKGGGGFAPPVRELPRGQLVPSKWEENADGDEGVISFRYKCGKEVYSTNSGHTNDSTTVYLALQLLHGSEVLVIFGSLPKDKSEKKQQLKFSLGQHVNLDGFQAAKAKNGSAAVLVSPSLFYISLSELLLKFNSAFGALIPAERRCDESGIEMMPMNVGQPELDTMPEIPSVKTTTTNLKAARPNGPPGGAAVDPLNNTTDPLRVMDSHRRDKHGDFEGDLLPGGPQPGGLHGMPNRGAGSQVGPNHPMFDRTFGDDVDGYNNYDEFDGGFGDGGGSFGIPGVGDMGMRPRFDPFGPPGGPTEPGRGRNFPGRGSRLGRGRGRGGRGGRGRGAPPGGFGNPNPDHMTPPGGGYFS